MKNIIKSITGILLLVLMTASIFAIGGNGNNMNVKGKNFGQNQGEQTSQLYDDTQIDHQLQIDTYAIENLSQEEIDGLLLMREEEKLARDVYLSLYDIWGQQIFSNIAKSEETHTSAIKSLLDKYELEDPMTTDERGVFENQDLQTLYNQLVEQGSVSLLDALMVGATIEDLDIKDLMELNTLADNEDITVVYNNLEKGSRNHLRSFTSLIEKNGGNYEPVYISQEEYDLIISNGMETGTQYDSIGQKSQVDSTNNNENQKQEQTNSNMQGNENNNKDAVQQSNKEQSQNIISRMWRGFKGWFN